LEIWLDEFKGHEPVELFSKNKFPIIKSDTPSVFTLAPYDCQWYLLQKVHPTVEERMELPYIEVLKWKDVTSEPVLEELENNIFPEYFMKMRWFGGKAKI